MAKGKDKTGEVRPQRGSARRRREPSSPDTKKEQDPSNPETTENPEWWRGDPGKRGEVL